MSDVTERVERKHSSPDADYIRSLSNAFATAGQDAHVSRLNQIADRLQEEDNKFGDALGEIMERIAATDISDA